MLVLSRKNNESIMLGKDIEIKILGIEDGKVKLGIEAPKDVEIYRKEIYLEIQEENKAASEQKQDWSQLKGLFTKK
ncbi:carbon storage regulator, CsrA [Alkaliphilus metalliredigens QYMF]|uniref:Translational regulator CsrA n=1 Tax=Alkaliphilus metalliredigens (strain QYMF) TaxID=293826 RepID=CSRA_ALKMQ|nr:carbon storage regulator CsrA [Alkaliphilus metalliredigens]A6TL88.1 RecName: Full=Translational regulator CsrA [Alkaliphilus metalliredigens QYMF]ABR46956.1 carbon storage regulator, CsrA [Alkaliphilus metalliredigens QYMF]